MKKHFWFFFFFFLFLKIFVIFFPIFLNFLKILNFYIFPEFYYFFQKINAKTNNLAIVHEIIRTEIKEIEAFQETLSVRDQWELQLNKLIQKNKDYQMSLQNLSKGNAVASLLALGNKHESMHILKENIAKVRILIEWFQRFNFCLLKSIGDIENLLLLIDIINVHLGDFEITKFKREKSEKYFTVLTALSHSNFETSFKV